MRVAGGPLPPPPPRDPYSYDELVREPDPTAGYVRKPSSSPPSSPVPASAPLESTRLGSWIVVVIAVLFFSGMFVAYAVFHSSHPEVFAYGQRYLDDTMGALGVALLIAGAVAAAWGVRGAQLGRPTAVRAGLAAAIACGLLFLGVRGAEWARCASEQTLWGVKFDPCATPEGAELPCLSRLAAAPEPGPSGKATAGIPGGLTDGAASTETAAPAAGQASAAPDQDDDDDGRRDRLLARAARERSSLPADRIPPINTGLFFALYFGMTGLHALAVLAAILALLWVLRMHRQHPLGPRRLASVDGAAITYHVTTLIALFLFGFLHLM